jgi:hypothetical protein
LIAAFSSGFLTEPAWPIYAKAAGLRDSVGLLTFLLDHGGITIYDPFILQWWEPEVWKERIFHAAEPVPRHHVVLLTVLVQPDLEEAPR